MSDVTIRSNRQWRPFRYRNEVPPALLAPGGDLDWVDPDECDGFFRYLGTWYHLTQFERAPQSLQSRGWDGYHADGFTSGVVLKLSRDCETYRIGRYH